MAKREIYARFGVQLRNNRRVFRAEKIAPGAFGLYCFCVMDARAELPDQDGKHPSGFVAEEVVLGALARPHKERIAQAEALCTVDLLERVEGGFVVVKYEEHNDTWLDVCANRKAAKERQDKRRGRASVTPSVTRDNDVTTNGCHASVPISYSLSPADQKNLAVQEGESARGGPPAWFALDMVGMLEMNAPDVFRALGNIGERWLQYQAAIERGRGQTARAAAGYMTTTIRAELARAATRAGATKQPLGKVDPNSWITDTDFAKKAGT